MQGGGFVPFSCVECGMSKIWLVIENVIIQLYFTYIKVSSIINISKIEFFSGSPCDLLHVNFVIS